MFSVVIQNMARRLKDPIIDTKENIIYGLLFFFVITFIIKVVFGIISGSKALLASGIFAVFGIFITIVALLRMNLSSWSGRMRIKRIDFSHEKLEFIIVTGISLIIVIATGAILFSTIHLALFHTPFPPALIAAWIAVILAIINWFTVYKVKEKLSLVEETDINRIVFLLHKDFTLSILVITVVVISRSGFIIIDHILAILEAIFIMGYSIYFLYNSLKGLMDASCSQEALSDIRGHIEGIGVPLTIKNLRVNIVGRMLEIAAIINVSKDMNIQEAKKLVEKIKRALKENLSMPHETYVGVRSESKVIDAKKAAA